MKHTNSLLAIFLAVASSPTTNARFLRSSGKDIAYDEETGSSSSSWNKTQPNLHDVQEKDMSPETRVVGGTLASQGDFPWFVASTGFYFCGASLVHEDVVLTAAHCKDAFLPGSEVYVGALYRNQGNAGAQKRFVTELLSHPEYDDNQGSNDFLLLKLNAPVKDVEPILLNRDHSVPVEGQKLTAMGFGNLQEEGSTAYFLRKVDLEAFDFNTCSRQYMFVATLDGTERLVLDEEVQLCAGYSRGGKGTCQGDSGGPLVTSDGVQVGVVSMGVGCARADFAGIYARVSGAIDFIDQGICDLSSNPPSNCSSGGGDDATWRPFS